MSMQKGKYHRVNGKLVRRYKPRRKIVHNAEVVEEVSPHELHDIAPIRLEAILNGLWSNMTLSEKTLAISTQYFDPSNPAND